VVLNLGGNDIQHGDNADTVKVRIGCEEDRIVLTVRNQDPPIGPAEMHRICIH
jgi:signal transduction histidine kinase